MIMIINSNNSNLIYLQHQVHLRQKYQMKLIIAITIHLYQDLLLQRESIIVQNQAVQRVSPQGNLKNILDYQFIHIYYSGHLARHNRIHTGEKNFPCLFPGCQSRFSRQDNMMQHYRTHMSPKSRRTQKKVISEDLHPRPKLHAHQRIRSDPYRVERPLTIDQHLNNYKRSLLSNSTTLSSISSTSLSPSSSSASTSVKYNMPTPLGSVAASHMQRHHQKNSNNASSSNGGSVLNSNGTWSIAPISHQASEQYDDNDNNMEEDDEEEEEQTQQQQQAVEYDSTATGLPNNNSNTLKSDITFYQHKPLTFNTSVSFLPFTLLHPTRVILPTTQLPSQSHYQLYQQQQQEMNNSIIPPPPLLSSSSTSSTSINTTTNTTTENNTSSPSSSQAGLLQLAHIVSTFG